MSLFSMRYRLNHCRNVLQRTYKLYKKKGEPPRIKEALIALENAINSGERKEADRLTRELEGLSKEAFPQSRIKWALDVVCALAVALALATVIRQSWFELYEIPTGSMRPTFKEQDHLTVSKTQFGINIPLETDHFYFNPSLVQRNSAIIFSGDGIDLPDTDSTFLGIFPYKKRYVKRMMGLPGDQLYFYGGQLYGMDHNHQPISGKGVEGMEKLEYIPLTSFEGSVKKISPQSYTFSYFHQPLAKATMTPFGTWQGQIFNGSEWVPDRVLSAKEKHSSISTLSDHFGMRNYGMSQIYTKEDLKEEGLQAAEEAPLYLVIRHTPHLDFSHAPTQIQRLPLVMTTVLPLKEPDLKTLFSAIYTSRFDVKNGKARRYSLEPIAFSPNAPAMPDIPDGTYEYYYGKAYRVGFGGHVTELPSDHPLYTLTKERLQLLYNLGTNWDNHYQPKGKNRAWPNRYVYYREGDLYTLGSPLLKKGDSRLTAFIQSEEKRGEAGSYIPFKDHGEPSLENRDFFSSFGLKIPKAHYLVLGDNHAMSGDSRLFGFVPEANLQGVPEFILWPFGERFGRPNQVPYATFVTPRLIIWALALLIGSISYVIYRRKLRKPLEFTK